MYVYIYIYIQICTSINKQCIYIHINIIYIYIYIHIIYIYIYIYMYTYTIYIYTYIHYITLHYNTLHYNTLHDMTWHDITYIHKPCICSLYFIIIYPSADPCRCTWRGGARDSEASAAACSPSLAGSSGADGATTSCPSKARSVPQCHAVSAWQNVRVWALWLAFEPCPIGVSKRVNGPRPSGRLQSFTAMLLKRGEGYSPSTVKRATWIAKPFRPSLPCC